MAESDGNTNSIYNNSDTFTEPTGVKENGAIDQQSVDPNQMSDDTQTTWIEVTRNTRRYKATIDCIHVPGSNLNAKIDSLSQVLGKNEGFLGCKPFFTKGDIWLNAIFENEEQMSKACNNILFENNEFKLQPVKGRYDEDTKKHTLVVRDLPLDVNKSLLKVILEEKFGESESIRFRLAGPYY